MIYKLDNSSLFISIMLLLVLFLCTSCFNTAAKKQIANRDFYGGKTTVKSESSAVIKNPDKNRKRHALPAVIPKEKPIVKIISGVETCSIKDAQKRLSAQTRGKTTGLKKKISTIILKSVPVGIVAEILTDAYKYNVVATKKASDQKVDIYMHDISLRKTIETICRLNGLWYREGENIVTLMTSKEYTDEMVIRRNEKTRAYFMRYTNAMDMAKIIQAVMGAQVKFESIDSEEPYGHVDIESGSGGGGTSKETKSVIDDEEKAKIASFGITSVEIDAAKFAKKIGKPLPAVITVFKRNNCIIARSLDSEILMEIGRITEALDTPTSQVLLEIKILQLNLSDGFESFFDINYTDPRHTDAGGSFFKGGHILSSLPGSTMASSTLNYFFSNDFINARLAFYKSQNRLEVVSTPFIMSANNSSIEFFVGEETPLRDDVSTKTIYDDEGNIITTIFEVDIKRENLGINMSISSFINEDSTVTMDIETEISTANLNMAELPVVNEVTGATAVFQIDGINKSEIESIIAIKSGQSVAIGGIIKEQNKLEESKVPILGDMPGLGFFFTKIIKRKSKTETVFILTPHVILHPALLEKTSSEFLDKKSSHSSIVEEKENLLKFKVKETK